MYIKIINMVYLKWDLFVREFREVKKNYFDKPSLYNLKRRFIIYFILIIYHNFRFWQ